ncbi:hypothetical protein PHYBOEH_004502 [Phytophthora boehmeriae]|uniref:PexRD2 WYL domain-containing protein n=1 Tax=Phytophthora boehmeriae TaxID=109152 RepID=A0A8T1WRB0_9STRA|nr:hypothetical protein PHYBOEH_004502 [Phytophthora boehmeriae]
MRACYLLLAIVATALASTEATVSADSKQNTIAGLIPSSPSTLSLAVRDNKNVNNRALRGTNIDDLDSLDGLDDDADEGEDKRAFEDDEEDDEERGLTLAKMKKMRKKGMTKEDYAVKLGISDEMASIMAGGPGLVQFMQSHKYQKYQAYMNYLIAAKKKGK